MNSIQDLSQLSMSQVKSIAQEQGIEVTRDRRLKSTWIAAIETQQTVIEVAPAVDIPDYQPPTSRSTAPQPPTPAPHRQASIVALIPLILLSMAVVAIRIGFITLIPLIASVGRLSVAVWRSIFRSIDTSSLPIDYFPA